MLVRAIVLLVLCDLATAGFLDGSEGMRTDHVYCSLPEEAQALLSWREQMVNSEALQEWSALSTWDAGSPPCEWEGITCGGGGVETIALDGNQLGGDLPRGLSCFGSLRTLNLANNNFHGPVPAQWSRLTSLTSLTLSNNQLTNRLPVEFSNLASLQVAELSANRFSGPLPPEWDAMTVLKQLALNENFLSGNLPREWAALSQLRVLNAMDSGLQSGVPDEVLTAWSQLQVLKLGGSSLDPGSAGINLDMLSSSLTVLDLKSSGLRGPIPHSVSSLRGLVELDLSGNRLQGPLPAELSMLESLQVLNLHGNAGKTPISGELPLAWSALANLKSLRIGDKNSFCTVRGSIPAAWSVLTALQDIDVSYCRLSGSLPASFSALPSLKTLGFSFNSLSGTLPPEYSVLRTLTELKVNGNQLTGSLPPEYSALESIWQFLTYVNRLEGTLPPEYSAMTTVGKLSLRSNLITGTIPESWGTLPNLFKLAISDLRLHGTIPESFVNLADLKVLWLGDQALTGTIPSGIGALTRMEQLHLHRAQLTGTIPPSIALMANYLHDLSLASNNLTGTVPVELCALKQLKKLRLDGNKLQGAMPHCQATPLVMSVCSPEVLDPICFRCDGLPVDIPQNPKCSCPPNSHTNTFCGHPEATFLDAVVDVSCFDGTPCPTAPPSGYPSSPASVMSQQEEPRNPPIVLLSVIAAVAVTGTVVAALALFVMRRRAPTESPHGWKDIEGADSPLKRPPPTASSSLPDMSGSTEDSADSLNRGIGVSVVFNKMDDLRTGLLEPQSRSDSLTAKKQEVQAMFREKEISVNSSDSVIKPTEEVKMLELLGMGATSRVYKAKWHGVTVAQKVMHLPYLSLESGARLEATLAMEAAISASLCHPNVVQTYSCEVFPITASKTQDSEAAAGSQSRKASSNDDSLTSSEESGVVMWEARIIQEYCSLGSLEKNLRAGVLPGQTGKDTQPSELVALQIARDIAAGMMHIHAMQVVHGDLKTGNILLQHTSSGMIAKVADFGLSIQLDNQQTHMSNITSGTVTHMSPELLQYSKSSAAADVYAFGIMMYELFAGLRAWKGKAPGAIMTAVVTNHQRPVFPPTVALKLVELSCRCWAQNPRHRPIFKEIFATLDHLVSSSSSGVELSRRHSRSTGESSFVTALPASSYSPEPPKVQPSNDASCLGVGSSADTPYALVAPDLPTDPSGIPPSVFLRTWESDTEEALAGVSSTPPPPRDPRRLSKSERDMVTQLSEEVAPRRQRRATTCDDSDGSDIRALQLGGQDPLAKRPSSPTGSSTPIIRPVSEGSPLDIRALPKGVAALRISSMNKPRRARRASATAAEGTSTGGSRSRSRGPPRWSAPERHPHRPSMPVSPSNLGPRRATVTADDGNRLDFEALRFVLAAPSAREEPVSHGAAATRAGETKSEPSSPLQLGRRRATITVVGASYSDFHELQMRMGAAAPGAAAGTPLHPDLVARSHSAVNGAEDPVADGSDIRALQMGAAQAHSASKETAAPVADGSDIRALQMGFARSYSASNGTAAAVADGSDIRALQMGFARSQSASNGTAAAVVAASDVRTLQMGDARPRLVSNGTAAAVADGSDIRALQMGL